MMADAISEISYQPKLGENFCFRYANRNGFKSVKRNSVQRMKVFFIKHCCPKPEILFCN